jgi:hypothetical protein
VPGIQPLVMPTRMAVAGVEVWAAAGGLDFEAVAWDFGAGVVVVGSAGVMPRMATIPTMGIHPINAQTGTPAERGWKNSSEVNMSNGFGRGRGMGRGFRGGMGFGFRGSSPPWPYVGIGRGGLPRCGYFSRGAGASSAWPYQQTPYPFYGEMPFTPGEAPPFPQMTKEEEFDFLRGQAEAIKGQLDQIETRMRELESKE